MDAEPVVFVVDDDPSVLKALTRLLGGEGFHTMPFASPVQFLRDHDPDVPGCIILDFAMPGFNGLELQKHLGRIAERQPIIFVSGQSDIPISVSAMKGGAADFLTKPVDAALLIPAVRSALRRSALARQRHAEGELLQGRFAALTSRERAVFERVVEGRLNKQIAGELGIAEKTVKVHRGHVMEKMQARSIAELVQMAGRLDALKGKAGESK
jgi:FixJ family two-component response regulator